jgi:hypothetical protein
LPQPSRCGFVSERALSWITPYSSPPTAAATRVRSRRRRIRNTKRELAAPAAIEIRTATTKPTWSLVTRPITAAGASNSVRPGGWSSV